MGRRLTGMILGAALVAVPVSGFAQHMNAPDAPCRSVGPNSVFTHCLSDAARQADARLAQAEKRIRDTLPAASLDDFQNAEQDWERYKNGLCDAEYHLYDGGSGGPAAHFGCLEALTRHHQSELETVYGRFMEREK